MGARSRIVTVVSLFADLCCSFVTISTVGYDDLTAATNAGRTAAVFEAVLGQP